MAFSLTFDQPLLNKGPSYRRHVHTLLRSSYSHDYRRMLRQEINDGLNVTENWNSANGFIFCDKGGGITTNRLEDQEIAVLSLHLLQACLVYIKTLMIQNVLAEPEWFDKMTPDDLRALSPLIYAHVNLYGRFEPDMSTSPQIETALFA